MDDQRLTDEQLEHIKERLTKARAELSALCHGKQFRMCIPLQDDDSDQLIGAALRDSMKLIAEVDRLREENERLRDALRGIVVEEYSILDLNAEDEWWTCNFCGNIVRKRSRPLGYNSTIELLPHDPQCAWDIARKMVAD
jgi:uncharacterized protein with PIN domain